MSCKYNISEKVINFQLKHNYSWLWLMLILALLSSCSAEEKKSPQVKDGKVDFSNWDFENTNKLTLDGNWNFFPNQCLTSLEQLSKHPEIYHCYVPGKWSKKLNDFDFSQSLDSGTYYLQIHLPDTLESYTLKLKAVLSTYEVWVDDGLLSKMGKNIKDKTDQSAYVNPNLIELPKKRKIDLFVVMKNRWHTKDGGFQDSVSIGKTSKVQADRNQNAIGEYGFFIFILTISGYLLILYFFHIEQRAHLYLSLFAIFGAMKSTCKGERLLVELIPHITYVTNLKMTYIGGYVSIAFIILYLDVLFKEITSKYFKWATYLIFGIALLTVFLPMNIVNLFQPVNQLVSSLSVIYCLYIPVKAIVIDHKRILGSIILFGILLGALSVIHAFLYLAQIVLIAPHPNFGYALIVFSQALVLAYNHRMINHKSKKQAQEVFELNKNLELKVEDRTKAISEQNNKISQQAEELRTSNEKLQELDKVKNRFFANISHELRTPLTLILGGINRIRKKNIKEIATETGLIEKHTSLLYQLINQLLDITKVESGKMELNLSREPIIKLLYGYFFSFESLTAQKNIQLEFHSSVEECQMSIDRKVMEKIIFNLLSNAYKFTPANGKIKMEVNVDQDEFQVKISDTGIGISEKDLSHIFDRFYQADASMQRNYEGTGIGLSLVKELLELKQGNIQVESKEGVGTTFLLTFPLLDSGDELGISAPVEEVLTEYPQIFVNIPSQTEENVPNTDTEKPLLLIVEDHADLQELIAEELKNKYKVLKAKDGEEGVEKALEYIPDLIVSDVMMPKRNGYELCEFLKKDERTSHIPIILLTARTLQENKIQGLEVGADDYLAKPFDQQELSIRAHNLIQSRKLLRERFAEKTELVIIEPSEVAQNATDQAFLAELMNILEQHYTDETFNPDQIADLIHINKRQLNRKLKAMMDSSATKLLQNFRLQKAKELLHDQAMRVGEVGFMVGFASRSYFNRIFKNKFGITPKEYQSKLADNA